MILTILNGRLEWAPQSISASMGPSGPTCLLASFLPNRSGSSLPVRATMYTGGCLQVVFAYSVQKLTKRMVVSVSPVGQMIGVDWAIDKANDSEEVRT